jgi:hypothetical protein
MPPERPVLVTTAPPSPEVERRSRERRYLLMMGLRVVAFIVAILVARGWVRIVAVALALVLPWAAVVVANSGPRRRAPEAMSVYRRRQRALPPGQPTASEARERSHLPQ